MAHKRTYTLHEAEAELLFGLVSSHCTALRNYVATAVEAEDFKRAAGHVAVLRDFERLYAKLNVPAHRQVDALWAARDAAKVEG